jgi:hypothetical protein
MVEACTLCELAFPLAWCTITKHALLHLFEPEVGRIALYGAIPFFHMDPLERWNKFLRSLLKARKHMEASVCLRFTRYMMITMIRLIAGPDYFHVGPSTSMTMSYAEGNLTTLPIYLRDQRDATVRGVTGKGTMHSLTTDERTRLTAYFKRADPKFGRAWESMFH